MLKELKNNYELMILTIVAFVIRLINLGKLNLWLDEGVTAETIQKGLSFIIKDSFKAEPTPPLYNILMYVWRQVFGDSEFALRFPSALFGAFSICLVYLIGKKYISKQVGMLASTLLIANPFYLYYSQEARAYSFFTFLTLLSIYYFPKALVWEEKKKFLLITLLVPWVHAYGVFLILAQNLYVLIKYESEKKSFLKTWLKYQIIIILNASIWYIYFLINNQRYLNRFRWIKPATFNDILDLLKSSIGEGEFIVEIIFIICLLVAIFLRRKQKNNHDLLLLFLWPLSTILLPILIGHFWHPFFMGRYAIAASMVIVLLVLAPLDLFLGQSRKFFMTLICLSLLFNMYQVSNYFQLTKKDEWSEVLKVILKNDQQDSVVILEDYYKESSMDYYLRKLDSKNTIRPFYLKDLNQMRFLFKDQDHLWFIYSKALPPEGFNSDQYFIEEKLSQPNQYLELIKIRVRSQGVL